jgi:PAS domain S-box-containing protein
MTETILPTGEQWYRALGDVAPGFFWVTDLSGRILYVNRTWEEYTGSSLEEINAGGWGRFNHPDELPEVQERWDRAVKLEQTFEMELRYRRHDGVYRWMLARVSPYRDADGQIQSWVGTSVDIDDLKRTEAALRRQEQELSDLFESATIGLHWVASDGTILRANQAELDLLGYRREDYVGRNIVEFHEDRETIDVILERSRAGEVLHDYPARLRCKDGSLKHVLIDSSVYFEDGQFIHTRCFTRDVTVQRSAEEVTARLAAIVASSSEAIIGKTLEGVVTSWNAAAERIFGYRKDEMVGQSVFALIPPEFHDSERVLLERISRGERVEFSETERIRKDGERIYISLSVSPIFDAQGRVVGASSIKRDITERKRAADALAQSQERLRLALQAARMGTWQWDIRTNALSWDKGLHQLYGVEPGKRVTRHEDFLQRVHHDDRDFVVTMMQRAPTRAATRSR